MNMSVDALCITLWVWDDESECVVYKSSLSLCQLNSGCDLWWSRFMVAVSYGEKKTASLFMCFEDI